MAGEVETKIEYLGQPGVIGEVTYDALKKRIAELEAALHKIAERTKRAHSQAQEGEIHHIAITALAGSPE